jgi:hypothetical protein
MLCYSVEEVSIGLIEVQARYGLACGGCWFEGIKDLGLEIGIYWFIWLSYEV